LMHVTRCLTPRLLFMLGASSSSPLFPYTTLFRSDLCVGRFFDFYAVYHAGLCPCGLWLEKCREYQKIRELSALSSRHFVPLHPRSEEHTSELQSRENLVCRLLLEKKNRGVPPRIG